MRKKLIKNMEDLSEIANLHIKEKKLPYLQPVEKDFYKRLVNRYKKLREMFNRSLKDGNLDNIFRIKTEMDNFYNIILDIYKIRLEKIIKKAMKIVEDEDSIPEGLAEEEEILIKELVELLRKNKEMIFSIEESVEKFEEKETIAETSKREELGEEIKEEKREEEKEVEYIVVRTLNDLPEIVGIDGMTYGPFKKNDIALLPKENANALKNKKLVEIV